jgi:hypothetical protein
MAATKNRKSTLDSVQGQPRIGRVLRGLSIFARLAWIGSLVAFFAGQGWEWLAGAGVATGVDLWAQFEVITLEIHRATDFFSGDGNDKA